MLKTMNTLPGGDRQPPMNGDVTLMGTPDPWKRRWLPFVVPEHLTPNPVSSLTERVLGHIADALVVEPPERIPHDPLLN